MKPLHATPDQAVIATECWCCGRSLYKAVPRRRRGSGHVRWACTDCGVAWSAPTGEPGTELPRAA